MPGCVKTCTSQKCADCFLYRRLLVVAASTFGFLIDGIETEFLRAGRASVGVRFAFRSSRASVVDPFDCGEETDLNRLAVGAYS
jgi:hypothetical protein